MFHIASARIPAESASQPPPDRGYSCEPVVVCLPLPVASLISPVLIAMPGSSAFTRDDLPTPDGPLKRVVWSLSSERRVSIPTPVCVLVQVTLYASLLYKAASSSICLVSGKSTLLRQLIVRMSADSQ